MGDRRYQGPIRPITWMDADMGFKPQDARSHFEEEVADTREVRESSPTRGFCESGERYSCLG